MTPLEEAILHAKQLAGKEHPLTYRALALALNVAEAEKAERGITVVIKPLYLEEAMPDK